MGLSEKASLFSQSCKMCQCLSISSWKFGLAGLNVVSNGILDVLSFFGCDFGFGWNKLSLFRLLALDLASSRIFRG